VSTKYNKKEKNYILSVGREPIKFVSEEYCHHALTHSATTATRNNHP